MSTDRSCVDQISTRINQDQIDLDKASHPSTTESSIESTALLPLSVPASSNTSTQVSTSSLEDLIPINMSAPLSTDPPSGAPRAPRAHRAYTSTTSITTPGVTIKHIYSTQSIVWKAFELLELERFGRLSSKAVRPGSVAQKSPFFPHTFEEYISHRASFLDDQIKAHKRVIALKAEQSKAERKVGAKAEVMPAFGGKKLAWFMAPLPLKGVKASARHLDRDEEFCTRGRELLGDDLMKEI